MENKQKTNDLVQLSHALRLKLEGSLSPSLSNSQIYVDFTDIYEICLDYTEAIDLLVSTNTDNTEKLNDILYSIHCCLFEHLNYHLKSLKKLLPLVIDSLESNKNLDGTSD